MYCSREYQLTSRFIQQYEKSTPTEIYLAWEELSQNKENYTSNLEQKFWKGSKGNKLKAPYKDRPSKIKNILQTTTEKLLYYENPKESLFYKERMAKV